MPSRCLEVRQIYQNDSKILQKTEIYLVARIATKVARTIEAKSLNRQKQKAKRISPHLSKLVLRYPNLPRTYRHQKLKKRHFVDWEETSEESSLRPFVLQNNDEFLFFFFFPHAIPYIRKSISFSSLLTFHD